MFSLLQQHCPVSGGGGEQVALFSDKRCLLCKAIHEGMNCQKHKKYLKRKAESNAAKATEDMLEVCVCLWSVEADRLKGGGSNGVGVDIRFC